MAESGRADMNKRGRGPIENNRPSRGFYAFGWEPVP
jgi:hypothetical protein